MDKLNIIGQEKISFIDYPDKICTLYFVAGCNFRCSYCHNKHVVLGEGCRIEYDEIFQFLEKKKKYIDGVCISGGEPTLYEGLEDFIKMIKDMGFLVKLDTNGTHPNVLKTLIDEKYIDFIAMDVKAPLDQYERIVKSPVNVKDIEKSIHLIQNSGLDYEFRTTICKELLSIQDIDAIIEMLKGSRRYSLQNFKDSQTVMEGYKKFHPYDIDVLKNIEEKAKSYFEIFKIRK